MMVHYRNIGVMIEIFSLLIKKFSENRLLILEKRPLIKHSHLSKRVCA